MRVRYRSELGGMVDIWCCGNDVLSFVGACRCVTSGAGVRDVGVELFAFECLGLQIAFLAYCKRY